MFDVGSAEHEAAHVVVGCALGLRLRKATIVPCVLGARGLLLGYAWFEHGKHYMAHSIMVCAGIAWESRPGGMPSAASSDYKLAKHGLKYTADVEDAVKIARELLAGRRALHARIASELCDRDLGPKDIESLVLGL